MVYIYTIYSIGLQLRVFKCFCISICSQEAVLQLWEKQGCNNNGGSGNDDDIVITKYIFANRRLF